ncbi:gag-pol polyprotein [Tanacetum coccineum]
MATKFEIEKFNGNNFSLWKLKMKAILRKDKCLAAIGERPTKVTNDSKWDEMDENAIANLHLALADGVLSSIKEKKSAKEIWDHLARLYEARSLHNKFFLKRKLYALRMTESTSVTEHINNLNTLFSQLTSLSCKIDSQERAEIILQSLPDSYDQKENRRNNREDKHTSSRQVEALVVTRGRSMEPGSSGSHNHGKSKTGKKKNFKCFKCGKPGHFRKDFQGLNTSYPQGNVASIQKMITLCIVKQRLQMKAGRDFQICNDHELKIIRIGSIMVKMHDGTVRTIQDVRHVKGLKKNLLSLGKLDDLGCKAEASVASHSPSHRVAVTWHQKFGHMSEQGMKILVEIKLLPGLTKVSLPFREHCVISKQHRLKFKTSNSRSVYDLELVHSDVWQAPVYPIKKKSDVFKVYKARVELDSEKKIKCLRTDNGGEYTGDEFDTFCRQKGIKRQFTTSYTPQQNGVRADETEPFELKTTMEMWTGKPVNYLDLHIFGSPVYVMYNTQETTKLDPKSRKCLFLGYADGVKGYHLWDPTSHKVVVSRDVVFMEDKIQENKEGVNETNESQAPTTYTLNRERRRPGWHSDYVIESNVAYCLLTEEGEPSTVQEALNNPNASFWKETMQEEIEALHKNKT